MTALSRSQRSPGRRGRARPGRDRHRRRAGDDGDPDLDRDRLSQRPRRPARVGRPDLALDRRPARLGRRAGSAGAGDARPGAVRARLGRVAAHRRRPRRRSARESLALPAARRAVRDLRRRLDRRGRDPARAKAHPSAVRITDTWYAPVGGLLTLGAAGFALLGFPLDDVSHRLFGQDVTLWGATHLMMMSGAVISVLGIVILLCRGPRRDPDGARRRASSHPRAGAGVAAPAGAGLRHRRIAPVPDHARGRRDPRRAVDLPGRVRLRRAAVPAALPPGADRLRGRRRADDGAAARRSRRRPGRGRLLPRAAGADHVPRRRAARANRSTTSRSTSPRRCWSRAWRC